MVWSFVGQESHLAEAVRGNLIKIKLSAYF